MSASDQELKNNRIIRSLYTLPLNMKGPKMSIPENIQKLLGGKRDLTAKKDTILSEVIKSLLGNVAGFMYQKENVYNNKIQEFENNNVISNELNIEYYIGKYQQIQDVRKKKSEDKIIVILPFFIDDYDRMNVTEKYYWEKLISVGLHGEKNGITIEFETLNGNKIIPSVCHEKLPIYVKRDAYGRIIDYNSPIILDQIYNNGSRP